MKRSVDVMTCFLLLMTKLQNFINLVPKAIKGNCGTWVPNKGTPRGHWGLEDPRNPREALSSSITFSCFLSFLPLKSSRPEVQSPATSSSHARPCLEAPCPSGLPPKIQPHSKPQAPTAAIQSSRHQFFFRPEVHHSAIVWGETTPVWKPFLRPFIWYMTH